jgi:hypothetical protein
VQSYEVHVGEEDICLISVVYLILRIGLLMGMVIEKLID